MKADKLVRMANQIALNFEYGEDRERAVAGVVDHLTRFWTPEMRAEIIEHAAQDTSALSDTAAAAVATLAERRNSAA
jgi:formate dehydrogenase subunit delta